MNKKLYDIPKEELTLEEYALFLEEHNSFDNRIKRIRAVSEDVVSLVLAKHAEGGDDLKLGNFCKVADVEPEDVGELEPVLREKLEREGLHLTHFSQKQEDDIYFRWEELND